MANRGIVAKEAAARRPTLAGAHGPQASQPISPFCGPAAQHGVTFSRLPLKPESPAAGPRASNRSATAPRASKPRSFSRIGPAEGYLRIGGGKPLLAASPNRA